MIVRRLHKEDLLDAARIRSISFHGKLNEEEAAKNIEKTPEDKLYEHWGCFDEDGSMMACIINNDFTVRFDGQLVKMGGIGGVATLPEYRYGGAVKETLRAILKDARENGEVFSSLYPFSHEFYRKAGYEMFSPIMEYQFPPALVSGYKHTGWTKRIKKGEDNAEMKRVYAQFAEKYNLMLERPENRYRIGDPFGAEDFTMLLGDERGARAYLYYQTDRDGGNVLHVRDIAFTDAEGFRMCLGYLGRMSADYAKVRLAVPADIPLMQMVARPYEVTPRFKEQPMARTTNVFKVLGLMKKPADADFTIRIEDDFLPENSGVYHVTAGKVEKTEAEADLSVDQRTFTLLALGALSLDEAAYRSDVKISANRAMLSRVFVKKPLFIADYF